VAASWAIGETSEERSGIKGIYLLKTLLLLMPATLLLQGVSEILKSALVLMGRPPVQHPQVETHQIEPLI
jgi:TRAP-type mannitol/chloroaromatic compound transport system permease small subunit